MLGAADGVYVPSTDLDLTHDRVQTDDTIRAIVRELARLHAARQAGEIAKHELEDLSMHYGWNHEPTGLLADDELGVGAASVLHYDWFHRYTVSGMFQT